MPLLLPNLGPEYRPATVGPTRRNSAVAPEATARSHESVQRPHPGADAPNGFVIAHHIIENPGILLHRAAERLADFYNEVSY